MSWTNPDDPTMQANIRAGIDGEKMVSCGYFIAASGSKKIEITLGKEEMIWYYEAPRLENPIRYCLDDVVPTGELRAISTILIK